MSQIVLSILTVTKNCVSSIERTLDSVAMIKNQFMEYVVVDGVSTDGTLDILNAKGALIDLLVSESDSGIYNAMNKAIALSRGRYILFINGDDELLPHSFSCIIDLLKLAQDEILCASTVVGDPSAPDETLVPVPWRLLFCNSIPHPSSFILRDLLVKNPFREDLRIASDYDFFLRAYLEGRSIRILNEVTAIHRRGGASGDALLSAFEIELVKRERLGWRHFPLKVLLVLYRYSRPAISRAIKLHQMT